jgi:hypothetical protein
MTNDELLSLEFESQNHEIIRQFDILPWNQRCFELGIKLRIAAKILTSSKTELVDGALRGGPETSWSVEDMLNEAISDLESLTGLVSKASLHHLSAMAVAASQDGVAPPSDADEPGRH